MFQKKRRRRRRKRKRRKIKLKSRLIKMQMRRRKMLRMNFWKEWRNFWKNIQKDFLSTISQAITTYGSSSQQDFQGGEV